ncbi:MAG TPA: hypothetical protein VGI23_13590 [Steroidobacteraceae bacterium]
MFRRPFRRTPALLALGVSVALQMCFPVAHATANVKPTAQRTTALGGFVKDRALARLLGETLFRDTLEVMSDPANQPAATAPASEAPAATQDNSAVARIARTVLAHQRLDKYIWLIQQAYDDSMWKGGDRTRIEQHFPLIWRTSIMLYEASLSASPHRVRVCTPADNGDGFDCRDEVSRPRIVPIPADAPLIFPNQPTIG